jgi:hypothetical protein
MVTIGVILVQYELALCFGQVPFQGTLHPPRYFGIVPDDACTISNLQIWMDERNTVLALLRQQLLRVQHKMKVSADKKRTFREFAVDDMVFLKLQPYI